MKATLRERAVSELDPRLKQILQQYISRDEKVLICYEASQPGSISAYLLTDRFIASVTIRIEGALDKLLRKVAGDYSPIQDTRMLFLRDIAYIKHVEAERAISPYFRGWFRIG